MALETITRDEFDKRLNDANERLKYELSEAQKRVQQLEELIRRKEDFSLKLDKVLREIEGEEAEIAAAEKELGSRRPARRRTSSSPISA